MKNLFLGLVVAVLLSGPAAAVSLAPDQVLNSEDFDPLFDFTLNPGESFTFPIEPTEPLIFDGSISGTGEFDDLAKVLITVNGDAPTGFGDISPDNPDQASLDPGTGTAEFLIEQFIANGDFGIEVALPGDAVSGVSIAFSGEASVAPVPLPAGAWFLISAIAGLGVLRTRREKAHSQ